MSKRAKIEEGSEEAPYDMTPLIMKIVEIFTLAAADRELMLECGKHIITTQESRENADLFLLIPNRLLKELFAHSLVDEFGPGDGEGMERLKAKLESLCGP